MSSVKASTEPMMWGRSSPARRRRPPRGARAVNAIARAAARVGMRGPSLDEDAIVEAAESATGYSDFGSVEYVEPMGVLLDSLRREARLTPLGRYFARGMVQHALENRLRLTNDWSAHPEILEERIVRPLFVVGLPRTGTTILQHLLSLDPAHRSLLGWEAASPSPPPERATYDTDPRITGSARTSRLVDYLAPEARVLHPVGPQTPTECVTLFVNSFASLETTTINWLPSYLEWCLAADYRPHYAFYARQLQQLQWKAPGERWLLKSPAHVFWLDIVLETFPDACIVMTHRDPLDAVTSYCSLSSVLMAIGSDHVDLAGLGPTWSSTWAQGLERAAQTRDRYGDARFVDVQYDDLLADGPGTVRRIYEHFSFRFDPAMTQRMTDYLARNPAHKGGVHRYSSEQFGIDRDEAARLFAPYRERFAVRAEQG